MLPDAGGLVIFGAPPVASPAQMAETFLLEIYVHGIDGQSDAANQRITDALGAKNTESEPGGEEDDDTEQAS